MALGSQRWSPSVAGSPASSGKGTTPSGCTTPLLSTLGVWAPSTCHISVPLGRRRWKSLMIARRTSSPSLIPPLCTARAARRKLSSAEAQGTSDRPTRQVRTEQGVGEENVADAPAEFDGRDLRPGAGQQLGVLGVGHVVDRVVQPAVEQLVPAQISRQVSRQVSGRSAAGALR